MLEKAQSNLALICIDLQKEYFRKGGSLKVSCGDKVLGNVERLLRAVRNMRMLIVHVRQVSDNLGGSTFQAGSASVEFVEAAKPVKGETVITKSLPGAFCFTELNDILFRGNIDTIAVCGFLSFLCVGTTAREAHARGYQVYFIKDATAAIGIDDISAEIVHKVTCAIQNWAFSRVIDTDGLIEYTSKAMSV